MKTKLLLSILFLSAFLQSNAQNVLPAMKPRPADYEYLSAPDSLGVRHSLKMPNVANKNSLTTQTKLPYPIIFIHGLNSGATTAWNTFTDFMDINYLFSYGGRFDISLNDDNDLYHANLNIYPTAGADIAMYQSTVYNGGDYYYVNFAVNSSGAYDETCTNLSNQSAIAKQGIALRNVIIYVMQLTGRDKVILMGHSMGGLAAREYLQNPSNWVDTNTNHHVAKLVTTGTPHKGSNASFADVTWITSQLPDPQSEAVRDLRTSYYYSPYAPGVFLYGGIESNYIMNDMYLNNFYNVDVNCNGIIGENLSNTGLNQKTPQYNLDYSCIIGTGLGSGDGVVSTTSANINNIYANLTPNIFNSNVIHTSLTSQQYQNMQGLDEPYQYNLAYGVGFNKNYYGFITVQSQYNPSTYDFDEYKFTLTNNSQVNINIGNTLPINIYARIIDVNGNIIDGITNGTYSSNGTTTISITKALNAGQYYLEIIGNPTTTSYMSPYFFNINYTLSTDNFESNNSLNLFPNPTSSKVFFDNTIDNFKEVAIYNYLGQEVAKTNFTATSSNQEIDMSSLATGVYVLKFSDDATSKSVKVVKQ
jgi:triacylglycerol esterase/lipase EstA (alpha/beta hydrolase family)